MFAANFSMFTATRATSLRTHVGVIKLFAIAALREAPPKGRGLFGAGDLEPPIPVTRVLGRGRRIPRGIIGDDGRAPDWRHGRLRGAHGGPHGCASAIRGGSTRGQV